MVSNADFQQYKADFLEVNKVPTGFVLMRRQRDNMLSICKKTDVEHYPDHVIEPFEQKAPEETKKGGKAKKVETTTPEEA